MRSNRAGNPGAPWSPGTAPGMRRSTSSPWSRPTRSRKMLSGEDYIWLAAILTRRATRYTKKAVRAQAKGLSPELVLHLHREANRSLLAASRILRGLEVGAVVEAPIVALGLLPGVMVEHNERGGTTFSMLPGPIHVLADTGGGDDPRLLEHDEATQDEIDFDMPL